MWLEYTLASLCLLAVLLLCSASTAVAAEPVVIVKPAAPEWLEDHAAEELAKYAKAITGTTPQIKTDAEVTSAAAGSVCFILGPAERNKLAARLVQEKRLADLAKIPSHAEGFVRIAEEPAGAAKVVLLAGRQPLGTLYAVYDYLESQCGVGFFQDGEHVPSLAALPVGNVSAIEQPRFDNRLHFAWNTHEGIKKYHSYWWTLEDWKREFDWMAKRRMNLIRIDLWYYTHFVGDAYEQAFPEIGPETQGASYVALAGFPHDWAWPPKYRREMTRQMIAYGRSLGIRFIYCLDYATVPLRFVKAHPDYKYMPGDQYGQSRQIDPGDPHAVEVEKKYLSKVIELFGTDHLYLYSPYAEIDVGGGSPDKNLEMRIKAANGILKMLADVDPKSVWVTDTWDMLFADRWGPERTRKYLDSFPADRFYLFNTAADAETPPLSKENGWWYGKKWAFGVINAFAGEDALRGDLAELVGRVKEAAAQPNCTGLFMVPEMTHYNVMFWDLATRLAWQPADVEVDKFVRDYCLRRYGKDLQQPTVEAWQKVAQAVLQYRPYRGETFRIARMYRHYAWYHWTAKGMGNNESAPMFTETEAILKEQTDDLRTEIPLLRKALEEFLALRDRQRGSAVYVEDAVVLFRTYAAKCFNWETSCAYYAFAAGDKAAFEKHRDRAMEILGQIRDVLALCPSYSVNKTIAEAASVPGSNTFIAEMVRQGCVNWDYVTNDVYEQFEGQYIPRMKAYFDALGAKMKKAEKTVGYGEVGPLFGPADAGYVKNGWSPKEPQTGDPLDRIAGFMTKLADVTPPAAQKEIKPMKLVQQTPNCSDFDVIVRDSTAFRVVVPENIDAGGMPHAGGVHMIPGACKETKDGLQVTLKAGSDVEVTTTVTKKGEAEIEISLRFKNLTDHDLTDMRADVCAGVNHLPGAPGWANQQFFAGVPLDRDVQGTMWYEKITPKNLFALTSAGWAPMHPRPDSPSAAGLPKYNFVLSKAADTIGCAIATPDGKSYFFQTWNTDCYYFSTIPGNACMHLVPVVAKKIAPGATAEIKGLVGFYDGSREKLAEHMKEFRKQGK